MSERGSVRSGEVVLELFSRVSAGLGLLFHIVPQSDAQRGTRIIKQ